MTATPINLNKVRKAKAKADKRKTADANAIKFGQSKAQRVFDAARTAQAEKRLSDMKFETE